MTGLCAAGIAFNVRFMVALLREPKVPRVIYQMRMKLTLDEQVPSVPRYRPTHVPSVASRA